MKCPKCKATSGNDWSQCNGECPMPSSPHYINHKLTKWDAGNVLVGAADAVGEAVEELKDFPDLQKDLKAVRMIISKIYDKYDFTKEMGFGI